MALSPERFNGIPDGVSGPVALEGGSPRIDAEFLLILIDELDGVISYQGLPTRVKPDQK